MNDSEQVDAYIRQKHARQINRVMAWRSGQLVVDLAYHGYTPATRNVIKSVAKSVMSLCVGVALDKGLLPTLDTPIMRYLPAFAQGRDPLHPMVTVRHLLTMSSGIYWTGGIHYHCPLLDQMRRSKDWISYIADCAVRDVPGTRYLYKEWDVILLAKVLDALFGDAFDAVQELIYQPLGIHSERWYRSACGVYYSVGEALDDVAENRSNLTAEEMLRIGLTLLSGGVFEGKRIVSADYLARATAPSPANARYGYLFWLSDGGFGCRGYGGQEITVVPGLDLVMVMQATPTSRGMSYDDVLRYIVQLVQA